MHGQEVQLSVFPDQLMMWLAPVIYFVLFLAAILHWKLSRHWSLLVLAIASLCFIFRNVVFGLSFLGGGWIFTKAFGHHVILIAMQWILFSGIILGGIGAIGAIYRAIKLSQIKSEK